jgi:AbrB family looped-hinge helix DNA binding protein
VGKVTSKLQVTVPKTIAERYRIKPGDEIDWTPSGESIRVVLRDAAPSARSTSASLALFDAATKRQEKRNKGARSVRGERGWKREDLYDRGRPR